MTLALGFEASYSATPWHHYLIKGVFDSGTLLQNRNRSNVDKNVLIRDFWSCWSTKTALEFNVVSQGKFPEMDSHSIYCYSGIRSIKRNFKHQIRLLVVRFSLEVRQILKRSSHDKLLLANLCWPTHVGVCERHNNMLANCWRQIELVSILANFFSCWPTRI